MSNLSPKQFPRPSISDEEFETHVRPIAHENWALKHGGWPSNDAEYDEADSWADYLRNSYDTEEQEPSWR